MDYSIKIVLIGEPNVGKSSLLNAYCFGLQMEEDNTIGCKKIIKKMKIKNIQIKVTLLEISGFENDQSHLEIFFDKTAALIFVCDITQKNSLQSLSKWKKIASQYIDISKLPGIIIQTKQDLIEGKVKDLFQESSELITFSREQGFLHAFQTSIVNISSIEPPFSYIIEEALKWSSQNNFSNQSVYQNHQVKKTCCIF